MKKIATILLIVTGLNVFSQDSVLTINDLYIDFAIPDISAFNMLGETPENVAKPGNVKDFSAQLLNIASGGKSIPPGIALEVNPYLIFTKRADVTNQIVKYRESKVRGLQLTFGTLQDSLGSKVAYGIKWTIFDKADALMNTSLQNDIIKLQQQYFLERPDNAVERNNFDKSVVDFVKAFNENNNRVKLSEFIKDFFLFPGDKDYIEKSGGYSFNLQRGITYLEEIKKEKLSSQEEKDVESLFLKYYIIMEKYERYGADSESKIKQHLTNYRKENWNKSALHIAVGHVLFSDEYMWKDLASEKISYSLNLKHPVYNSKKNYGVGMIWQIAGNSYFTPDSSQSVNSFSIGNRIIIGYDAFRISFENMYSFIGKEESDDQKIYRGTLGFEFQISDGTWLEMAFGINKEVEEIQNSNNFISLMNFKYTLGNNRRFNQ